MVETGGTARLAPSGFGKLVICECARSLGDLTDSCCAPLSRAPFRYGTGHIPAHEQIVHCFILPSEREPRHGHGELELAVVWLTRLLSRPEALCRHVAVARGILHDTLHSPRRFGCGGTLRWWPHPGGCAVGRRASVQNCSLGFANRSLSTATIKLADYQPSARASP